MPFKRDWITGLVLAACLVALDMGTARAALPPYWQSAREIEAIVNDPRVHDALKYEEPILSISTTGDDVYVLMTERCTLTVTIIDTPPEPGAPMMVGPRQFGIEVGEAICR